MSAYYLDAFCLGIISGCIQYVVDSFLVHTVIISLLLNLAKSDLPPHCLHGDVVGLWEIHSGYWHPRKEFPNITDPLCGYSIPDNAKTHLDRGLVPPDVSPKFVQDENFKILFTPNKVLAADEMNEEEMESALSEKTGLEKKAIKKDGKESEQRVKATFDWTVVYDEGMEWSHDNRRYFAYFKYLYVGATKNLKIRSYCSTTMIGWSTSNRLGVSNGCWWGQKLLHQNNHTRIDPERWTNELPVKRMSLVEIAKSFPVKRLNSERVSATRIALSHQSPNEEGGVHWEPKHNASARLNGHGSPALIGERFDWTNPDDVYKRIGIRESVVPPPTTQGNCGSCYGKVAGRLLTSRLWIKYHSHPGIFKNVHVSEDPMLYCTPLSQGCDGGYVYLALKAAADNRNGLPSKSCMEDYEEKIQKLGYRGPLSPIERKCYDVFGTVTGEELGRVGILSPKFSCPHWVRVISYGYIGGAHGHGTERAMRDALLERGPFAVSIEPAVEFLNYKGGVYKDAVKLIGEFRDNDQGYPWMKVDHAALLVGYGSEKDEETGEVLPYWIVQNTWGPKWGENGYFRVLRGTNEMGIEGSPVEGEPHLMG